MQDVAQAFSLPAERESSANQQKGISALQHPVYRILTGPKTGERIKPISAAQVVTHLGTFCSQKTAACPHRVR